MVMHRLASGRPRGARSRPIKSHFLSCANRRPLTCPRWINLCFQFISPPTGRRSGRAAPARARPPTRNKAASSNNNNDDFSHVQQDRRPAGRPARNESMNELMDTRRPPAGGPERPQPDWESRPSRPRPALLASIAGRPACLPACCVRDSPLPPPGRPTIKAGRDVATGSERSPRPRARFRKGRKSRARGAQLALPLGAASERLESLWLRARRLRGAPSQLRHRALHRHLSRPGRRCSRERAAGDTTMRGLHRQGYAHRRARPSAQRTQPASISHVRRSIGARPAHPIGWLLVVFVARRSENPNPPGSETGASGRTETLERGG